MLKKDRLLFDYALIGTFLAWIFIPLFLTNTRTESTIEKRKLTPFPTWKWEAKSIVAFPQRFQMFFDDHFGFRDHFVRWYNWLAIMLGSSSDSNIIVGKNGWFFFGEDPSNMEDYRKNDPLTDEELSRWKKALERNHHYLKQQGIHYLFVIPAEKHSIYGEYYPTRITRVGTQSRLDQFMEYMRDSDVPILDLRQPFLQAKSEGLLYSQTDTHWNNFGAAVAQYEIMQYIAQHYSSIHPIRYLPEDFSWKSGRGGDITRMLNLSDIVKEKQIPRLHTPLQKCERFDIEKYPEYPTYSTFMTDCHSVAPSIVVFRDSFFILLQPYISQYFSKSLYVWTTELDFKILKKYVTQYTPDIVIHERVERGLNVPPQPE